MSSQDVDAVEEGVVHTVHQLLARALTGLQPLAHGGRGLLQVSFAQPPAVVVQPDLPARVAHAGANRPVVARRDEVDGEPYERALDDGPAFEGARQRTALKALDARPQPDVRGRRVLGLDAADALERLRKRRPLAGKEQLPLEQRAVELALGEDSLGCR